MDFSRGYRTLSGFGWSDWFGTEGGAALAADLGSGAQRRWRNAQEALEARTSASSVPRSVSGSLMQSHKPGPKRENRRARAKREGLDETRDGAPAAAPQEVQRTVEHRSSAISPAARGWTSEILKAATSRRTPKRERINAPRAAVQQMPKFARSELENRALFRIDAPPPTFSHAWCNKCPAVPTANGRSREPSGTSCGVKERECTHMRCCSARSTYMARTLGVR